MVVQTVCSLSKLIAGIQSCIPHLHKNLLNGGSDIEYDQPDNNKHVHRPQAFLSQ